ncbi:MAG TPA: hypothetical protein VI160_02005 [Gemmatimonadales bacterium]
MTRAALSHWLDARRPAPPPALRAHLDAALAADPGPDAPLADQLATLGRRLLERVAEAPGQPRAQALDLLAADALVTYAFEAQGETDVAGLAALAERVARAP